VQADPSPKPNRPVALPRGQCCKLTTLTAPEGGGGTSESLAWARGGCRMPAAARPARATEHCLSQDTAWIAADQRSGEFLSIRARLRRGSHGPARSGACEGR